jgi:mannose/cellobiose epimerase-like protein (N-acyl-D-glucosamine 2-epimerase family)
MNYFIRHYRRQDGFFRTLAGADGGALNNRAFLYDQAFALFGYAAAAVELNAIAQWESLALELRDLIEGQLRRDIGTYESNPLMHLLEAYLAWAEVGEDSGWVAAVRRLVELAVTRFIRRDSGALAEFSLLNLRSAPQVSGGIEPGHQFEWAWLLLRCDRLLAGCHLHDTALRLIAIGEQHGVRDGVAVNSLRDDLGVHDAGARLWPQCERLKASLLAATMIGGQSHWDAALAAAGGICRHLATPVKGLWFDVRSPDGEFRGDAVPASTFYHLVGAIASLKRCAGGRS